MSCHLLDGKTSKQCRFRGLVSEAQLQTSLRCPLDIQVETMNMMFQYESEVQRKGPN